MNGVDGGISESSSSSDPDSRDAPWEPICLRLVPHNHPTPVVLAAWDLLTRPDGMSVRRLRREFERKHGPPPPDLVQLIEDCNAFELFVPHRRPLDEPCGDAPGVIYADGRRHPHCLTVPCFRPHPLGNPWPVRDDQPLARVIQLCADLMLHGGSPLDWGGEVDSRYTSPQADALRESELARLAAYVWRGGSIDLRCCNACERERRRDPSWPCHVLGISVAITARVARARATGMRPGPAAIAASAYTSVTRQRSALPPRAHLSKVHVRRACPPIELSVRNPAAASDRLRRALAGAVFEQPTDVVAVVQAQQPLALAGAGDQLEIERLERPAAFSHRRLEPMPDAECLMLPFAACNVPPSIPLEHHPPEDPPSDLLAYDVSEVVPHNDRERYRRWARRTDRSLQLAASGDLRAARLAKPPDLVLTGVHQRFRGFVMDFSVYPFRPLLPSRWPDRPPRSDVRIRSIRREFRSHADYPDRQLRGLMSHGNVAIGPLSKVSYFAAPHGSVYSHYLEWLAQVRKERAKLWSRAGFHRSDGLATWPQRCQPTQMTLRHGKWRLCHDFSWPPENEPAEVESPNDGYIRNDYRVRNAHPFVLCSGDLQSGGTAH